MVSRRRGVAPSSLLDERYIPATATTATVTTGGGGSDEEGIEVYPSGSGETMTDVVSNHNKFILKDLAKKVREVVAVSDEEESQRREISRRIRQSRRERRHQIETVKREATILNNRITRTSPRRSIPSPKISPKIASIHKKFSFKEITSKIQAEIDVRSHQSTATGVFKAGEECVFKTDPPKTSSSQTDEIIHSKTRQYHHDRVKAADEALQALRSRYKEKREAAAAATASYTATARTWHKHHPTRQYESRDHPPPRPCPGDDSQRDEAQTYSSGVLETERQRNESDDGSGLSPDMSVTTKS